MLEVGKTYTYKNGKRVAHIECKQTGKHGEYFVASNGIHYDAEGRRAPGGLLHPNNMIHRFDDLVVPAYTNTREPGEFGDGVTVATDAPRLSITDIEDQGPVHGPSPTNDIVSHTARYDALASVLQAAYDQAATGKGNDRHANGKPFTDQPILEIVRMQEGIDGHTYQGMKKLQEAGRMVCRGQHDAAIAELYGVINYAAAAVIRIRELPEK